jgi:hypothetical protein
MSVVPATHRDTVRGEIRPVSRVRRLFPCTAPRTARFRFNPAASGRIAGSVAARRTYEGELAASEPDGTRVLMLPAVFDNSRSVTT